MSPQWTCGECGVIVHGRNGPDRHVCDEKILVKYQSGRLDKTFAAFIDSPMGQFEVFCAHRSEVAH